MRILLVSNTPFLPPTAGNRSRICRMVDFFQGQGIEVGLVMLPAPDIAQWDTEGMRRQLGYFEIASSPPQEDHHWTPLAVRQTLGRVVPALRRVLQRTTHAPEPPLGVDDWCPEWFRARVAAVAREWKPDAVLVEYVFLSACLDHLAATGCRSGLTLIDTHDVMHCREAAYAAAGLPAEWFRTSYAEERRGLRRADVVLAIQAPDAETLRHMLPGKTVLIVPHAQPLVACTLDSALPGRLLFVASYNEFNVHGLRWFFDAVWPELRSAVPGIELVVCGSIAQRFPAPPPGVQLRGITPDLSREYGAARLVINPIHAGTGLKVKIAEALCHGRPVVSTGVGAVGVATGDAAGVLVADTAPEFIATVRKLLSDSVRWAHLVGAAQAYAAKHLTPEAVFGPLLDFLHAHLRQSPGSS